MQTIDLSKSRVIVISDRGHSYTLNIKPISRADWFAYFDGIVSTSETVDGKRLDSSDSSAARLELLEKNLVTALGYNGDTTQSQWQQHLPLRHRLAAANALIAVSQAAQLEDEDQPAIIGSESIFLDAVWSADDDGIVRKFSNLRHTFRTPSAEHQRRFSRDASRSRIVGSSRTGKTHWLGAQKTLADLYDELIVTVEGYSANGVDLAGCASAEIVHWMDTYHKVAAADLLFSPALPKFAEE